MSNLKKSQRSLRQWTKQDWGTKSGKPSAETGERYLPKKAREALSSEEYAATTAAKRKDTAAGKQHSPQPKKIRKKTRQFRYVGGPIEPTQAPAEYLMEIGAYSKAEPYNPLLEEIQKRIDRGRKVKDVAMAVASPVKKKGAEKIYYHLTTNQNAAKIRKEGFNPLSDTNFVKAGKAGSYQDEMGTFLFTNPIAALKFAKTAMWRTGDENLTILPVKLTKGTRTRIDPSGDPQMASYAAEKAGIDVLNKKGTNSVLVTTANSKNLDNFLNKDVIAGKGKTVKELIQNKKNPAKQNNWYPQRELMHSKQRSEAMGDPYITDKQLKDYIKEIDKIITD